MKKGFTLIELLAVIVILAIIAVIAVPIVIDIIDDTKINSVKTSASIYLKAAELFMSNAELNKVKIKPGTYPITSDGNICIGIIEENKCNGEIIKIEVKGSKPTSGTIKIDEKSVKIDYLEISGYTYYEDNDEYIVKKMTKENVESNNGVITLNSSKVPYLTNLKIYGNSVHETRSGKNLFDVKNANVFNGYISEDTLKVYNPVVDTTASLAIKIKSNTTYTVSREILGARFRVATSESEPASDISLTSMVEGYTSEYLTITSGASDKYLYVWFYNSSYDSNSYLELMDKIQIEEGAEATEYEEYVEIKPSSEFPSEIQSVGDLVTDEANEHCGEYEIPIKVTSKNLFDVDDFIETYTPYFATNPPTIKEVNGEEVLDIWGGINADGRAIKYMGGMFKENTQYTFSLDLYDIPGLYEGFVIYIYYTDGTYDVLLGDSETRTANANSWRKVEFTSRKNKTINHIMHTYNHHLGESYVKNFQIEEGTNATLYEPYKEKIYSIYLDEPLRRVGETCDYIDFMWRKVVRSVGVSTDGNLIELEESRLEDIELPEIKINKGLSNIYIETKIKPSKFVVDYNN